MASQQGNIGVLIEAFEKFRSAILVYFIGILVMIAAIFPLAGSLSSGFNMAIGVGAAAGVVIGGILLLVGIVMLFQSAGLFAQFDPNRLGGFRTGLRLQLAAVVLLILGSLAAYASPGLGLGLIVIALIAALVGEILIGIFFLRLGDLAREGMPIPEGFRLAGILYLVGIIIPILQLIALIMAYVYAGDAARRLREHRTPGPAQAVQPFQPGQGF